MLPRSPWLASSALAAVLAIAGAAARADEPAAPEPPGLIEMAQAAQWIADAPKLVSEGRYDEAAAAYEGLVEFSEKAFGADHPSTAAALNNLAGVHVRRGEYAKAEALYRRALAIVEAKLGAESALAASTRNNLAEVHVARAEYDRAEPLYRRALEILERGGDDARIATALNNLGALSVRLGRLDRARELLSRSLAIRARVLGADHPDVAGVLVNLAEADRRQGDLADAEARYARALTLLEKAKRPELSTALNDLAVLRLARGDPAGAEALLQRAIDVDTRVLGSAHPGLAKDLGNLATARRAQGDRTQAARLYERARAILEKASPLHPDLATVLGSLSRLRASEGHTAEAIAEATRAAAILERHASVLLASGSEAEKRVFMATLTADTDAVISLHLVHAPADPSAARLALHTVLARKGRVLDAMMDAFAALRRRASPGDADAFDRLASVSSRIGAKVTRAADGVALATYERELAQLDEERQRLEAELSRRSAAFRAEATPLALEQVEAAIPEGAALVEIVRWTPIKPSTSGRDDLREPPRYAAYVLAKHGPVRGVDLGEAAGIEASASKLLAALADPDLSHDPRPAARDLDARVMAPLRARLGATRRLLVSPDGALALVPFEALVDEGGRYLVEEWSFTYLTSGRDLVSLEQRAAPRQDALVIADPSFGRFSPPRAGGLGEGGPCAVDLADVAFRPLASGALEASSVVHALPAVRVLRGEAATEAAVRAVRGPRVLHLATHGFYVGTRAGAPSPSPLLCGGLALTGANARASGGDDGILTSLEASTLDLAGTELVVLSTCDSGAGEASGGEGVYGLRRAFAIAGAETQVMSLWRVDARATRALMAEYYARLGAGAGRGEAMRDAQLAMIHDPATSHPNLWAAFVVAGSWRPLDAPRASAPAGKIEPAPRGCACTAASGGRGPIPATLSFGLGVALARRAQRSRRSRRRGRLPFLGELEGHRSSNGTDRGWPPCGQPLRRWR